MVRVMVTLLLGAGVANLFVIAPRFLGEAGYDKRDIGVVMGGFNLASLFAATAIAGLCRRFGYPRVIAAGCALAAAGAAVFAAADSMASFTRRPRDPRRRHGRDHDRRDRLRRRDRARRAVGQALGVAGVLTLVAMALGPALAQLLHDVGGWAWVWQAGIVSGVAAAALALTLPPIGDHAVGPSPAAARPWPALVTTTLAGVGFGAIWSFLADYGAAGRRAAW
jgi:MFS family permease